MKHYDELEVGGFVKNPRRQGRSIGCGEQPLGDCGKKVQEEAIRAFSQRVSHQDAVTNSERQFRVRIGNLVIFGKVSEFYHLRHQRRNS